MQVIVENERIQLDQRDLIGSGGEGNVFRAHLRNGEVALKVYHQPTHQRGAKLRDLIATQWQLPLNKIAMPLNTVQDVHGQIIGLTMPYLGSGFEEMTSLANKKYRASFLVNTKMVVDIFIDGWDTLAAIHRNNLCVGDFNDLNALFRGKEMLFIDADTWQFGQYPCQVGTEQFLAPELYGIDLSVKPMFKPEYDWYAYAVMLFKSLLLVHPYGGTNKDYKQITARAKHRVTVFDPRVTYPKIAIAPDLLDDTLAHTFDQIFGKGQRGQFPLDQLKAYADSLVECKSCGTYYPSSRPQCAVCTEKTIIVITKPIVVNKGIGVTEFIRTNGKIVYSRVVGAKVFVIAYEDGKTVLYLKVGRLAPTRKELFNEIRGARFEILGEDTLVVSQPSSVELLLLGINGDNIKPVIKTETTVFAGSRRSIFRTSNQYLFRIAAGNLVYGELHNGMLAERILRNVMSNQTWFTVRQEAGKPTAFGFLQVMRQQIFWLIWEGRQYDNLSVSQMETGETLIDISVKFSSQGLVMRRLTQYQGVNYYRTDMISEEGRVLYSGPRIREEDHSAPGLHGQAYSTGRLLHATDEGIMQEQVETGQVKSFDSTQGQVAEGDTLYPFQGGLLVIKDEAVIHIVLS